LKTRLVAAVGALIVIVGVVSEAFAKKDGTSLISRQGANAGGQGGDEPSFDVAMNAGGRYFLFETEATNLGGPIVPGVNNVYLYDRARKKTQLVSRQSRSAGGAGTDDGANDASISDDGRFVAFATEADNLGGSVDTDVENVYVYDRKRKKAVLVSRRSKSAGGGGADGDSSDPSISGNGRFVVFESEATNLSQQTNTPDGFDNVYVYDLERKRVSLVSRQSRSAGGEGADDSSETSVNGGGAISKSGRFVTFGTDADNLGGPIADVGNVYVYDRKRKKAQLVSRQSQSAGGAGGDSFAGDSVISRDGRFVTFETDADNLGGPIADVSNIYVYDRDRKKTRLVSRRSSSAGGAGGDDSSDDPSVLAAGRYIAFETDADNLGGPIDALAETNVYVYDLKRKKVTLMSRQSRAAGNDGGNDEAQDAQISASGRFVAFETEATNLGGPINTGADEDNVYLRDRG
jgi:TolB protein